MGPGELLSSGCTQSLISSLLLPDSSVWRFAFSTGSSATNTESFMQQNNCLVLNNSLHLYPSSLRHRAELTLGSVRKGKSFQGWGELGEQWDPSLCPLCPRCPGCLALPQGLMGCSWSSWCPAGPSCPSLHVPGVIPPQGKVYSSPV